MRNQNEIECIVFDYANTLSSDNYFQTHPESCANWREVFQEHIFSNKKYLTDWCTSKLLAHDIAEIIEPFVKMPIESIIAEMKAGCNNLKLNNTVLEFAIAQKKSGRRTALVTANIDLFTEIVVPFHNLHNIFDKIVNSSDYNNDNKAELWPIAFNSFGQNISYANSLLIDDSEKWIDIFKRNGGNVCNYVNDIEFANWLISNGYSERNSD
jgi:FMN phosphatase YigB (HAD superfamily)